MSASDLGGRKNHEQQASAVGVSFFFYTTEDLQMRNFKSVKFAWSKEILRGVVMCKAAKPMRHDFEYAVLVKSKRLSNTSDKSVVMKRPGGDISILLSIEHSLMRRQDVNDAIRIAMEDDIDANMVGRN
jgi:hypothetical protein